MHLTTGACTVVLLALAGCSSTASDVGEVGYGSYFQIVSQGRVVVERDYSGTGFRPCSSQAALLIRNNPSWSGRVKCARQRSDDLLPYSFVTHIQKTPETDEVLPSSPFVTRASTEAICKRWRDSDRKQEKTVIVRDECEVKPQ